MDSLKGTLTPMKVLNGTLNGGIAYGTFNYNELENKPSINGTELVGNVTIDIPTKISDLDNDSGFITNADVPTKTSELTNDSGFITNADVPTKTSELDNDSGFITSEDIPTIPTSTSQLNNDSGFLTMNTIPVKSVNSQTGDVNLFIPNATSQLTNDAGFITDSDIPVQSVNGQTGEVELTATDIPYDSENSIAEKIDEKANTSDVYIKSEIDNISTATINSAYATGNVYFKQIGNMVIVFGLITLTANVTTGNVIFSGVPKNNNGANNVIKAINNDGTSADWILYCGNTSNNYISASSQPSGKSYTISYAYYT